MWRSVPQTLAVSTSTSTSSGAGPGTGTSSSRSPGSDADLPQREHRLRPTGGIMPIPDAAAGCTERLRSRTVCSPAVGADGRRDCDRPDRISVVGSGDDDAALDDRDASLVLTSRSERRPGRTAARPTTTTTATGDSTPEVPGAGSDAAEALPRHPAEAERPRQPQGAGDDGRVRRPPVPVLPRRTRSDALPAIVEEYVRTGKVKLVFSGMHFIGPDSETALRAVYAAGLQDRLWNFLDLLYRNQGAENAGWVTDDLLRSAGASIPGFDTEKMLADMSSPEVDAALAAGRAAGARAHASTQTPTFFAGPTGGDARARSTSPR